MKLRGDRLSRLRMINKRGPSPIIRDKLNSAATITARFNADVNFIWNDALHYRTITIPKAMVRQDKA